MKNTLQWGGRFCASPDASLLAFGSSLEEDLVLAPFDVRCSLAHVRALEGGGIVDAAAGWALRNALSAVAAEIAAGSFADYARACGAEDIHGAIDARVRELAAGAGAMLHAGRSRNDQVATTLKLFLAAHLSGAQDALAASVRVLYRRAQAALAARTVLPAMTHWQPAQPALLAFWLTAAAQPLVRAARRCEMAASAALDEMPLGSAALCGSTLPLANEAAREYLGFSRLSLNAMDAIGSRDMVLDGAHALVTSVVAVSRICEELIAWCNPLLGFARTGDAASTGSSLMPQKRNPDPLELIRGRASTLTGLYAGALASTSGLALSYHRDLQQTKGAIVQMAVQSVQALDAFARTLEHMHFDDKAMNAAAARGFTLATDVADALVLAGVPARVAHQAVGAAVAGAEAAHRDLERADLDTLQRQFQLAHLDAPLTALASIASKKTAGSTAPQHVEFHLQQIHSWLETIV